MNVGHKYETERRDFPTTTPLIGVIPEQVRVLSCSSGVMSHYQKQMSKAVWRPAFGRKLGFLVVQDENLLGLIFLASPVIRLTDRDKFLFPNAGKGFNYGAAIRDYMDVSVCVSAQPVGWHWNLGKLMALIAPTLGDYVRARYPDNSFKGVTTTSLWGRSSQYNRIYKQIGYTKGNGHVHISDERYTEMMSYLRSRCPHCTPGCPDSLEPRATKTQIADGVSKEEWCVVPGSRWRKGCGDGANPRLRRIQAYLAAKGKSEKLTLHHGQVRGIYYHESVPAEKRSEVIKNWYERWGRPRYERTKNECPPYTNGLDGGKAKQSQE